MQFPKRFISATQDYCTLEDPIPAPYLRRSFYLDGQVESAELYICGLGFYELYVNGRHITKGKLAPYISNPDDLLYYDRYAIAPYLTPGENVIGVLLGNGMQNAWGGFIWDFEQAAWRGAPKVALLAEIALESGRQVTIESDTQFRTHPSPIVFDDLRLGEQYDARLEIPGWCSPGFDDWNWKNALPAECPRGQARLCEAEPIIIAQTIKPVSITPMDGGYLYDFGVNNAGICRLRIRGERGQAISMALGEHLKDGKLDLTNISFTDRGFIPQRNRYILKGEGEEVYEPFFTYHGFQYVFVTGILPHQATPELLTYLVMHSDLAERGGFSCSDACLNQLQEMTRRSTLSNFFYFPTDCPQREKNGWTGDAALSAEHTLLNLSVEVSYREWMRSVCAAQDAGGALPGIVPTGGWGFAWGNGPAWDCVLTHLPYYTYVMRGDVQIVKESATAIFRYLSYLATQRDEKGLLSIGLGDWCTPKRANDDYLAPLAFTDTVISMDICRKAAFLFGEIGWHLQQKFAEALAEELRACAREHLLDLSTMTAAGDCQTSQAMAIHYDVFDPQEKQQAFAVLKKQIERSGGCIETGILGARVLFHVLTAFGESELAYRMIVGPQFPSYGYWITQGATTLWEDFNLPEVVVQSRNHHFFGDISNWMIRCVGGIILNPTGRDVNEVVIAPHFVPSLNHAQAYHIAPAGKITVNWQRQDDAVLLDITVPQGIKGTVRLEPGMVFEDGTADKVLSSGEYRVMKK